MQPSINQYSDEWFDLFLKEVPKDQTGKEAAFLARQFPPKSNLLDLCCGEGRHAAALAGLGYDVTGIDLNENALKRAEKRASRANFVLGDVRNHHLQSGSVHGIYCLWQSFGFYTTLENRRLLADWQRALKPGGRLVLDVYNREFFIGKDGVRSTGGITESKRLKGNRLQVHLGYPNGVQDVFEWELFTLEELKRAGEEARFSLMLSCTNFDEGKPVSNNEPRMQLVFAVK
jgi:SAM-dependent methyltransferase